MIDKNGLAKSSKVLGDMMTILIPTGGRPHTLPSTLESCIAQNVDCLRVVVVDNSFRPETGEIVSSFKDERLSIVAPSRRLSMPENWEFALSHLDSGICSIIGDDDALLPNCINHVNEVFDNEKSLKVFNHIPANYFWPDYPNKVLSNTLSLRPIDLKYERRNSQQVLKEVSEFRSWYGNLPFLYHGFVSVDHLKSIQRSSNKSFFNYCAPDVYSDITLGMFTGDYLVFNGPLTLGGQSGRSNGANFMMRSDLGNQFISELPDQLKPRFESRSFSLMIYDALLSAFEAFPDQRSFYPVNVKQVLESAVREALHSDKENAAEILMQLEKIVGKAELLEEYTRQTQPLAEVPVEPVGKKSFPARVLTKCKNIFNRATQKCFQTPPRQNQTETTQSSSNASNVSSLQQILDVDLSDKGISNVFDAAILLDKSVSQLS